MPVIVTFGAGAAGGACANAGNAGIVRVTSESTATRLRLIVAASVPNGLRILESCPSYSALTSPTTVVRRRLAEFDASRCRHLVCERLRRDRAAAHSLIDEPSPVQELLGLVYRFDRRRAQLHHSDEDGSTSSWPRSVVRPLVGRPATRRASPWRRRRASTPGGSAN